MTENPLLPIRRVQASEMRVTMGGAPCYLYPGGGITLMAHIPRIPDKAFGYVPAPAPVAPPEFTSRADLDAAAGGHMEHVIVLVERHGAESLAGPWVSAGPRPDAPG